MTQPGMKGVRKLARRRRMKAKWMGRAFLTSSFWDMLWHRHQMGASILQLSVVTHITPQAIRSAFIARGWKFRVGYNARYRSWMFNELERLALLADLTPAQIQLVWTISMNDPEALKAGWAKLKALGIGANVRTGEALTSEVFEKQLGGLDSKSKDDYRRYIVELQDNIDDEFYHKDHDEGADRRS